jgi:hypothetical protein
MNSDNLYIEVIEHADTANVIIATSHGGRVQSHTFTDMAADQLAALMADMTHALMRDGSSVEDTLADWAMREP